MKGLLSLVGRRCQLREELNTFAIFLLHVIAQLDLLFFGFPLTNILDNTFFDITLIEIPKKDEQILNNGVKNIADH